MSFRSTPLRTPGDRRIAGRARDCAVRAALRATRAGDPRRLRGHRGERRGHRASSAAGSTGSHWRSSWRPPVRGCSRPEAMLERVERRLELLTGGPADAPVAAADPSRHHRLELRPARRARAAPLSRGSSVFRGAASLPAAEAVCGGDQVLDALTTLVRAQPRRHPVERARRAALRVARDDRRVRARASRGASGETDEVARRHAAYFADFAEEVKPFLYTDVRAPWLRRLADDRDNFRAALAWCCEQDEASYGLRTLGALWLWYWTRLRRGARMGEARARASERRPSEQPSAPVLSSRARSARPGQATCRRCGSSPREAVAISREIGDDATLASRRSPTRRRLRGRRGPASSGTTWRRSRSQLGLATPGSLRGRR